MIIKSGTIESWYTKAPAMLIRDYREQTNVLSTVVEIGGEVDLSSLKIGEFCHIIAIDKRDSEYHVILNYYKRIK